MNSDDYDKVIRTSFPSRYYSILGKNLICPVCGTGARDVAADFDLTPRPPVTRSETFWTCEKGHANATTTRRRA